MLLKKLYKILEGGNHEFAQNVIESDYELGSDREVIRNCIKSCNEKQKMDAPLDKDSLNILVGHAIEKKSVKNFFLR